VTAPTFGRIARAARVGDLQVIETIHPAGLRLPRHDHGRATITLTIGGGCQEIFRTRTVAAGAGTVVLKPAGESHANHYGPAETRGLLVELGPRASARIGAVSDVLDRVWTARGGAAEAAIRELGWELPFRDRASSLIIESCVWRVLGLAERERWPADRGRRPPWLSRVEEYLRENANRHLSLEELAAVADVHPGHLGKVFRRHFRESLGRYQRRLHVERARRLLLDSPAPLAQIAVETGFSDQSHFTRVFKAHVGLTPARYRSECASGSRRRG
jgi:AraC family transcriptional regulator